MLTIYIVARILPCQPPLVWISTNAYVFLCSGLAIAQVGTMFFFLVGLQLLESNQVKVSQVLALLIERLIAWEMPCLIFVAIANVWPDKASYSSFHLVLLCGVSVAIINTLLLVLSKPDFEKKDKEAAGVMTCFLLVTILIGLWLNFSSASIGTRQVVAVLSDVVAMIDLEFEQNQPALDQSGFAIEMDPHRASAYNTRACALQSVNRDKEAIHDCDISLSLKPQAETYVTRGYSYGALGNKTAQMQDYAAAIKLDSEDGTAYLYRAKALSQQGDMQSAARDLESAKKLHCFPSKLVQRQLQ